MLAPTPAEPTATAAEAACTVARRVPAELALTANDSPVSLARATSARTALVIVLVAKAPAPATPTAVEPNAAAMDAACAVVRISD